MAVINITITESSLQIMFGVPKSISVSINIPSTIFYTLDGTDPTTLSSVLVGQLDLPTDIPTVTLKLFATNGTDSSAIITKIYKPNIVGNRNPHDKVFGLDIPPSKQQDLFPFGENAPNTPVTFGNIGGITVDDPTVTNIPDGFDGTATGTPSNGTDKPLDQYELKYSETNAQGERGPGVGTLPATVKIRVPEQSPQFSEANSKLFNPKALVIFQDGTKPPEDPDMPLINRQYFNLENPEKARDGIQFLNTGFEGAVPHGSFLRAHFNPRENTYTFYYRDSLTNRWIISKEPYVAKPSHVTNLSQFVFSSRGGTGARNVYRWYPFKGRHLM